MKKNILILFAVLLISVCSCNNLEKPYGDGDNKQTESSVENKSESENESSETSEKNETKETETTSESEETKTQEGNASEEEAEESETSTEENKETSEESEKSDESKESEENEQEIVGDSDEQEENSETSTEESELDDTLKETDGQESVTQDENESPISGGTEDKTTTEEDESSASESTEESELTKENELSEKETESSTEDVESSEDNIESKKNKKWTIIVYMAADSDLESACISDLNEMEAATKDENVNILALVDRSADPDSSDENWSDTRLYEIKNDSNGLNKTLCSKQLDCPELNLAVGKTTELNMADKNVLKKLLVFSQSNYQAENYGFVIWGHGTGYRNSSTFQRAVVFDDESESSMLLTDFHEAIESGMNEKFAFIAFDTSFGAELEVAYELKDCAKYIAGFEGTTSYDDWNYYDWLNNCGYSYYDSLQILQKLDEQYVPGDQGFSIIDLSRIENVFEKFELFSLETAKKVVSLYRQNRIFEIVMKSSYLYYVSGEESSVYADIFEMSQRMTKTYKSLATVSSDLQLAIKDAVVSTSDSVERFPLGINFCIIDSTGTMKKQVYDSYIKNDDIEDKCLFVQNSEYYVPTDSQENTLLNKLFYTTFTK